MAEENASIKDFYFLHIPKTGGSHFKSRILNEVYEDFQINSIPFIRQKTGHDAWSKSISDSTYITTILRDPVKRTVSHFCHLASVFPVNANVIDKELNKDISEVVNYQNRVRHTPSLFELRYEFQKWLERKPLSSENFQAKNILFENVSEVVDKSLGNRYDGYVGKTDEPDNWWNSETFKNFSIDELELKKKLKRIDLLIDNESLKNKETNTLIFKKIFNDFNIERSNPNKMRIYGTSRINSLSQDLYSSLSKKEIDNIYEINKIDSEIYFSDYFTDLG